MLAENEIIHRFREHGMFQGHELYLKVPIALNFLTTCQENNLAIIGVEGFLSNDEEGWIQPIMDYIEDYSDVEALNWEAYRNSCHQRARDFLCNLPSRPDLVINFVVVSQEEWPLSGPIEIVVPLSTQKEEFPQHTQARAADG